MQRRRGTKPGLVVLTAALGFAAACGSGDAGVSGSNSGTGASIEVGLVNGGGRDAEPVRGGTLRFSENTPTLALDPTIAPDSGATGNIALAAVFDVLMRYDPASGTYAPQLARSLTPSPDHRTWTLELRPGVHFTDGTPLDAEAVVFNLQRYAASPRSSNSVLVELIAAYDTPDPHTVVFHLSQPWAGFPFLLASNAGMMVSPAAVKAKGRGFAKAPVGAGPFRVASFTPGEKIELVRNDRYWGDGPYLDGVTITSVATSSATLDRLESGQVDMVFMLDAKNPARAIDMGFPGYVAVVNGSGFLLNIGDPDAPTADVRVRRALAAALNPPQLNQRLDDGHGLWSTALFGSASRWHTDAAGPSHDPQRARSLVGQVRGESRWDGAIEYLGTSQRSQAMRLTFEAQMEAVGFQVEVVTVPTFNDLIRKVFVDKDFQVNAFGSAIWDSDPFAGLYKNYLSTSPKNPSGYGNPELDRLIDQLGAAGTIEAAKSTIAKIQTLFTRDVPFLVARGNPNTVFWSKDVHGVVPTSEGTVLLDKAFMEAPT